MAQTVFEQASEQIDDTMHKASRAASSAVEAIEDGVGAARRVVKQGGYAVAELCDDARRRVQRNPVEAAMATFVAGIATGAVVSWLIKRKMRCNCAKPSEKLQ